MPNKNKINYQSQSVYVGPTPSTGQMFAQFGVESIYTGQNLISGLYRIQSANHSFNINRVPVNQFGEAAAIDRVILQPPTVSLSLTYLLANFLNEKNLGFCTDGSQPALSGILNKVSDDKNYFIKIVNEGIDSVGNSDSTVDTAIIGFGNGYVTSYSTKASVGSFPSVDVGIEAINMIFSSGTSGISPAVTPSNGARITQYSYQIPTALSSPGTGLLDISTLRQGDITLTLTQRSAIDEGVLLDATGLYNTLGTNITNAKIQDYNISFSLNRESLQRLGNRFASTKEVNLPVDISLSINAIPGDLTTGSLSEILSSDNAYDCKILIKQPVAPGNPQAVMASYWIKNAKLNSHSFSSSIGSHATVSLNYTSQIGASNTQLAGLWMSGVTDVQ